jgi:NTP pyrophosphatase (non-canonical NTP hydrolase)
MSDNNLKAMKEELEESRYKINTLRTIIDTLQDDEKNFAHIKKQVEKWAFDKGIYTNSTATAQLLKAVSEMGELADAELKGYEVDKADAVGDVLVCLINYCKLSKLGLTECLYGAYDTIKARQGKMVNGAFVKDE